MLAPPKATIKDTATEHRHPQPIITDTLGEGVGLVSVVAGLALEVD